MSRTCPICDSPERTVRQVAEGAGPVGRLFDATCTTCGWHYSTGAAARVPPDAPSVSRPTERSLTSAKAAVLATLAADLRGKGVDPVPLSVLQALEVAYDMGVVIQGIRTAARAAHEGLARAMEMSS